MSKTFGLVLGIIGITFIAANIGVLGMELNVVLARRLWPRALLTPFTDSVELTHADRKAYTSYARAQRHKGFEEVTVRFDKAAPGRRRRPDRWRRTGRGARTEAGATMTCRARPADWESA